MSSLLSFLPQWLRWPLVSMLAISVVGSGAYLYGKHEGRQAVLIQQLKEAVKAERERSSDDAKLRNLSDYDFCTLALRRRSLPVDQCGELRGLAQE